MLLNLIQHHSEDTLAYNRSQVGMTSVFLTLLPYLFFSSPVFSSPCFAFLYFYIFLGSYPKSLPGYEPLAGQPFLCLGENRTRWV